MSVGSAIRKRRKLLNLSLQQLASKVGTDSSNLSRMERGAQGVSESVLRKLCAALDCTPAFLYAQDESPSAINQNSKLALQNPQQFVDWFRSVAPYIHAFGGRTFVIAFGGEVVDDGQFVGISHDLNLLASLGVRLVLVHGSRPQIEARLRRAQLQIKLEDGLRVTNDAAMEVVKEANGAVRVEIEAALSMGLVNSPMAGADIRVASGNFVKAKPVGVLNGVDLQNTGEVRKIDAIGIQKRLDDEALVLLSPLGYSLTGKAFNLSLEDVAASAAIALDADKLIFLMDTAGVHNLRGELLREMTSQKARNLLSHVENNGDDDISEDESYYLPAAIRACEHGVARTHMICRHTDGAILQELFTYKGIGTMVTEMPLETMRPAIPGDVAALMQLVEPLGAEGVLAQRGQEHLEMDVEYFYVMEHDGRTIGCAALYPYPEENAAEIACVAIHPDYRGGGRGNRIFSYCVDQAETKGLKSVFVLTTRTEHWFVERGFIETSIKNLPIEKQKNYNLQRRSKIFMKQL